MKQALKYPFWGSFFSQKQEIWSSEVAYCLLPEGQCLCGGALLSQYEACVRTDQQLNLHLEVDGICHFPLLGRLEVRVRATGLLHPKYHQCPLQHSCSAQGIKLGC